MQQQSACKLSLNNMRYTAYVDMYYQGILRTTDAIIDNGAMYTNVPSRTFRDSTKLKYTGRDKEISGTVKSAQYLIREVLLDNMSIGGVIIGTPCCIYVTEDVQVSDVIVGMDILSRLDFAQKASMQTFFLVAAVK